MMFEGLGLVILELVAPVLEDLAPIMPGDTFPRFFNMEMMQRSLIASIMVTIVDFPDSLGWWCNSRYPQLSVWKSTTD